MSIQLPDFRISLSACYCSNCMNAWKTRISLPCKEVSSIILFLIFYLYAADIPKVYRYSCYYWLPVAVILISFSLQKGIFSRILSNRFLVIGGEISYSFYLIHLFVLLTYSEWQKENNLHTEWYISVPILFSIIILLSLLC